MATTSLYRSTASLLGIAASVSFGVGPARATEPIGLWQTQDGRARIRTEYCGSGKADLCGYVVWLRDPRDEQGNPRLDKLNADASKTSRPLLGHAVMEALKLDAEGRYDGKVYNADDGNLYNSKVWSDNPSALTVKGCVAAVFCGTQVWARVNEVQTDRAQGGETAGARRSKR